MQTSHADVRVWVSLIIIVISHSRDWQKICNSLRSWGTRGAGHKRELDHGLDLGRHLLLPPGSPPLEGRLYPMSKLSRDIFHDSSWMSYYLVLRRGAHDDGLLYENICQLETASVVATTNQPVNPRPRTECARHQIQRRRRRRRRFLSEYFTVRPVAQKKEEQEGRTNLPLFTPVPFRARADGLSPARHEPGPQGAQRVVAAPSFGVVEDRRLVFFFLSSLADCGGGVQY